MERSKDLKAAICNSEASNYHTCGVDRDRYLNAQIIAIINSHSLNMKLHHLTFKQCNQRHEEILMEMVGPGPCRQEDHLLTSHHN